MTDEQSPLQFPTAFPIKVMGNADEAFEAEVLRIFRKHVPDLGEGAIRSRDSAKANYRALTVTITAHSREQLDAIYQDLTDSEHVIMAL
jgi:putative lipoic acid-binding regulatory protein